MARIVIAEDEPDIRQLIDITLTSLGGHEVHQYTNGQDLIDNITEIMPDIVLLDVRMPKMSGYEACAAIKANPKTKHIPVVFLSAKGQNEEVEEGMDSGATAYILKPFAPDTLVRRITKILDDQATA